MIFRLDPGQPIFPHPSLAEEDGLLAVGGDLSAERLLQAYSLGIFPWYSEDTPILWYAPHTRFVLHPQNIRVSKSMHKILTRGDFGFTADQSFEDVIRACAGIDRKDENGTWIVPDMLNAYIGLHKLGYAHSIEVWQNDVLVGGLYGILVGRIFCGESMFSKISNASKAALIYLCQHYDLDLIDCQVHSSHLESMGAGRMAQRDFLNLLTKQTYSSRGLQALFRRP